MKRRRQVPMRLEWPTVPNHAMSNQESIAGLPPFQDFGLVKGKSTKTTVVCKNQPRDGKAKLWTKTDQYDLSVVDLSISPKKVKEVEDWFEASITAHTENIQNVPMTLLLTGCPGIGKSTMCRVLARELGVDLIEWNNEVINLPDQNPEKYSLYSSFKSELQSFQLFLQSAGFGCQSLLIVSDKSPELARERKRYISKKSTISCILIDEIPNLHNFTAVENFREILSTHILKSKVPTIIVYSNVTEGRVAPHDLEKLVHEKILYDHSYLKICHCNPVTNTKMKSCLVKVIKKYSQNVPNELINDICSNCSGDLRNAIITLQLHLVGQNHNMRNSSWKVHSTYRDSALSTFHLMGKLLYAKREATETHDHTCSKKNKKRAALAFDPERVIDSSKMSIEALITLLPQHSPEFFTDVEDLSKAFQYFSDSFLFLAKLYSPQKDRCERIFPLDYISSIAGRTVAETNNHPSPNKFRSFVGAKVFDMRRKAKENDMKICQLKKKLSCGLDSRLSMDNVIQSSQTFVCDILPYVRKIIPKDIYIEMNDFHSLSGSSEMKCNVTALEDHILHDLKDQQSTLENDDITQFPCSDIMLHNTSRHGIKTIESLEHLLRADKKSHAPSHDVIIIDS